FWREPKSRSDDPHVLGGEFFARRDVAYRIERAAERHIGLLHFGAGLRTAAERLVGTTCSAHERDELVRFERERRVGAAVGTPQGEMLFDQAGAERYGGNRDLDPQRVVRQ